MQWPQLDDVDVTLVTVTICCCLLGYWLVTRGCDQPLILAPCERHLSPANLQRPMSLPAGKVHFKADKEWKEVMPHHVLPNGLEAAGLCYTMKPYSPKFL